VSTPVAVRPGVIGPPINVRDSVLERVVGANVTRWTPREYVGRVQGLALGLPAKGARRIDGMGAGLLGVGVSEDMHGVALGGLGVGAGGDVVGIGHHRERVRYHSW
jgi:hypothetical protein